VHENHDQGAYVARVTTRVGAPSDAGSGVAFYAVLADTKAAALAAIQATVKPADYVEMTDGRLSPKTARALDLQPGQAKAM
jgi:hypothetical protein